MHMDQSNMEYDDRSSSTSNEQQQLYERKDEPADEAKPTEASTDPNTRKESQQSKKGRQSIPCTMCEYRANHNKDLHIHVQICHNAQSGMKYFNCVKCSFRAGSKMALKRHLKIHSDSDDLLVCEICTKKKKFFYDATALAQHMEKKHRSRKKLTPADLPNITPALSTSDTPQSLEERQPADPMPKAVPPTQTALNDNEPDGTRNNEPQQVLKRKYEDQADGPETRARMPWKKNELPEERENRLRLNGWFLCPHCKFFKAKSIDKFQAHMYCKHTENNQLRCSVCDEKFMFQTDLDRHLLYRHNGQTTMPVLSCSTCSHIAPTKAALKRHNLTHRDTIPCPICQQTFYKPIDLKQHTLDKHGTHM